MSNTNEFYEIDYDEWSKPKEEKENEEEERKTNDI